MSRRFTPATVLALAGTIVLLIGWLLIHRLGDQTWWALPILFGPRWIWLGTLLAFLPLARTRPRRGIPLLVAATLFAVITLLGFRLGLGRIGTPDGDTIRVMAINDEGGGGPNQAQRLADEIRRVSPDIVVISECGPDLRAKFPALVSYLTYRQAQNAWLCLVTRGEIRGWLERGAGNPGNPEAVRVELTVHGVPLRLGMIHLATPRRSLEDFRSIHSIPQLGPHTAAETEERRTESANAVEWIDEGLSEPVIVAGDFNIPVESAIYRDNWSQFRNAFSETGIGTGYSKHTRLWGIRIDHVLTSTDIIPVRSFVGKEVGSDHIPMVADLVLPGRATSRP
ncbi:MAG TPA: endonuclease/exonuclease/phosphatase family protein [Gemmatimonadales bacterium]